MVHLKIPMGWGYYIVGVGVLSYAQLLAVLCVFSGIIPSYVINVKRYKRFVKLAVVDNLWGRKLSLLGIALKNLV